jgi:hypothetical protein
VTDSPPADESPDDVAGAERLRLQREKLAQPRSFFSLIPRGDLAKVVLLLVLLVIIVALQRRSGSIVKRLTDGLYGPPPPAHQHEAPKVRMAPPVRAP